MKDSLTQGRYDYFVLQSSTAGGYALNQFLNTHPDIHMPTREIVDQLFDTGQEVSLCAESGDPLLVPPWSREYKLGFLLHSRVQINEGIPARVAALCKPDAQLFQLVRDPVKVIVASHKRYLQINMFNEVAKQLKMPGYQLTVPERTPEEVYEWLKPRLFYYQQAQRFAADFKEYRIVDATDIWPEQIDATMRRLYGQIGVNDEFSSAYFHKDFHGFLQRMLEFSRVELNLYGHHVPVRMEVADNVPFVGDTFSVEIARINRDITLLGGETREVQLALVANSVQWNVLPEKLKAYLGGSDDLQHFLETELLPQWDQLYQHVKTHIEERWVRRLPEKLLNKMRADLSDDYRQIFKVRPDLESLWNWEMSASERQAAYG